MRNYKLLGFNIIIIIGFLIYFLIIKGINETLKLKILSSILLFVIIPLIFISIIPIKLLKQKKNFSGFILMFLIIPYNYLISIILSKIFLVTFQDFIFFTIIVLIVGFLEVIHIYKKVKEK